VSEPRRLPRWLFPVGLAGVLVGGGLLASGLLADTGPSYKNFVIPSESMEPTLRTGEQFVARTSDFLPIERGGIYLVRKGGAVHAYRVIGLPGDQVELTGSGVVLNSKAAAYDDKNISGLTGTCHLPSARVRRETLPSGESHAILACGGGFGHDMPATKIPAGHYFLLGDNRANAADSRFSGDVGLGLVPESDFVGKATRIFISSDSTRIGKEID
jgi:signal peptidase I